LSPNTGKFELCNLNFNFNYRSVQTVLVQMKGVTIIKMFLQFATKSENEHVFFPSEIFEECLEVERWGQ